VRAFRLLRRNFCGEKVGVIMLAVALTFDWRWTPVDWMRTTYVDSASILPLLAPLSLVATLACAAALCCLLPEVQHWLRRR
jgi:hypothetical protein